jgi:hypothetical protein
MDDEMRKEALGEVLMDELKVIREYVEEIPNISKKLDSVAGNVDSLKNDMQAVKAVAKNHESRIKELETA